MHRLPSNALVNLLGVEMLSGLCIRRMTRAASAALVSLGLLSGIAFAQSDSSPVVFQIATASKAGTFYPIGRLIAEGISTTPGCAAQDQCGVDGLIAVAQVSNGSVANVDAVAAGSVNAGLAQADVIYWAYNSKGRFEGDAPRSELRALANLYPGSLHIVTSSQSDIETVADLRGKRVALDEPGSGTLATAELILAAADLDKSDLTPLYIKHNHAGPMLEAGALDAFFFVAGYPTGSVLELSETTPIRLVPLSEGVISEVSSQHPYLAPGVIPAGTYPGVEAGVPTLNIGTQLIVHEDLDPQLAHDIVAAMWNGRTRTLLDAGHPKGTQVRLETATDGVAIPFHEGAARFYRAQGLLSE